MVWMNACRMDRWVRDGWTDRRWMDACMHLVTMDGWGDRQMDTRLIRVNGMEVWMRGDWAIK